jgi:hypothetical protein
MSKIVPYYTARRMIEKGEPVNAEFYDPKIGCKNTFRLKSIRFDQFGFLRMEGINPGERADRPHTFVNLLRV